MSHGYCGDTACLARNAHAWTLQVDDLARYLLGISAKDRQRYYTALLRGRRRDTSTTEYAEDEGADAGDYALASLFT